MKTRSTIVLLLLCICTHTVFAQKTDAAPQKIFAAYPAVISISAGTLQNTFSAQPGQTINVAFSDQFVYSGTVLSNEVKYHNLQSVIIQSPAFNNALLQISRITNEDKSVHYRGRIINPAALDGYEIKMDAALNYSMQKFETRQVLQECNQ